MPETAKIIAQSRANPARLCAFLYLFCFLFDLFELFSKIIALFQIFVDLYGKGYINWDLAVRINSLVSAPRKILRFVQSTSLENDARV